MVTILTEQGPQQVAAESDPASGALWMANAEVERVLGWTRKPEGLCRGPVCVPLGGAGMQAFVREEALDVAGLWQCMGKPVRRTAGADTWLFGEGAADRTAALESLEPPDFTLPDLAGERHALSDYRGRKVLLATWASW